MTGLNLVIKQICLSFFLFSLLNAETPPETPEIDINTPVVEHVEVLTQATFDSFVAENEIVLVKFYAPWCHYCKKLAPAYEEAALKLSEKKSAVKIAKVDCTVEKELADTHEVKGYPTLKLFRRGISDKYTGGRTADEIVEWLETMSGAALSTVQEDELKEKLEKNPVTFVVKTKTGSDLHKTFEQVADGNRRKGAFIHIENAGEESVHVHRSDEDPIKHSGEHVKEDLTRFVNDESFPLFGPINGENFMSYAERAQEIVWLCSEKEDYEKTRKALKGIASETRPLYSFVWLDSVDFGSHATEALGVSNFPSLVYQSKEKGRFIMSDADTLVDADKVKQWFQDVNGGKIEKNIKSEEVPETNEEFVKKVVGKSFESIVFEEGKDVMLEVYAPWCKHCQQLEPHYNTVAESFADVSHITIAKMDGILNESPVADFEWTGFPTIFFVKAGTKTPTRYEGERTVDALIKFVKENASKKVEESQMKTPTTTEAPKEAPKETKDEL